LLNSNAFEKGVDGGLRLLAFLKRGRLGGTLARQAIDALDDSRIADGITESRYPSSLPQIISPFR
jgi:hypothetical protein